MVFLFMGLISMVKGNLYYLRLCIVWKSYQNRSC
nr:MAG TPA: hypothetical protein [Caudoviricetes sp.]